MNEFLYTAGDSKPVPLYHHGQFPTSPQSNIASPQLRAFQQFDGQQLQQEQHNISLFSNTWHAPDAAPPTPATDPVTCDLQEVLLYYRSQPELLRLILLSKVEEDKRRTEEARLRAKELDILLLQQQQQLVGLTTHLLPQQTQEQQDETAILLSSGNLALEQQQQQQQQQQQSPSRGSSSPLLRRDSVSDIPPLDEYQHPFSPNTSHSSSSTPSSLLQTST
ncbi:hypothetical protein BX666DRAFT_747277 [Dichotomocladium elegans]|nr:hypothetical protein BX666DRAFT_747277 [Dichotomocladium elegans]